MNYKTHNDIDININGSSLKGHINIPHYKLVDRFGEPQVWDDYKTDAQWVIEFDDGLVATIYNWKNGVNYCGDDGIPTNDITEWNIGGKSMEVVDRITTIINEDKQMKTININNIEPLELNALQVGIDSLISELIDLGCFLESEMTNGKETQGDIDELNIKLNACKSVKDKLALNISFTQDKENK